MRLMKAIQLIGALCVALLTGCAAQSTAQPAPAPGQLQAQTRSVSTTGSSTIYVKPDKVTVHFSVESHDPDLGKAKTENVAASRAALEAIRSLKIEDKNVQSQRTRIERDYEQMPDGHRRFIGYEVLRRYSVKLDDMSQFEPLVDALLAKPEYTNQAYLFDTKDHDQLLEKARQQATQVARQRAKLLANELNCDVGSPAQIREATAEVTNSGGNLFGGGGGRDESASGVTPLGEFELTATVEVTFDLLPRR
jgi:uncharacterized protein YggE